MKHKESEIHASGHLIEGKCNMQKQQLKNKYNSRGKIEFPAVQYLALTHSCPSSVLMGGGLLSYHEPEAASSALYFKLALRRG